MLIDIVPGTDVTFTVVASGSALNYQWLKDDESLTEGSKYGGTMTATLSVFDVMNSDEGGYQCIVGNAIGTVLSMTAVLTTRKYRRAHNTGLNVTVLYHSQYIVGGMAEARIQCISIGGT